jgi:hypothetical protein
MAKELDLSCINVVNVEDSPITKVNDEKKGEEGKER